MNYDSSLKYKWDNENVTAYAIQHAVEHTRFEKDIEKEKAIEQTAKKLKDLSISTTAISLATGLREVAVEKL